METIGNDLRQMQRTALTASHVEALRAAGKIVVYAEGVFLARPVEPANRFIYIEEGEIEVVNPYTDKRHLPFTRDPTQLWEKSRPASPSRLILPGRRRMAPSVNTSAGSSTKIESGNASSGSKTST